MKKIIPVILSLIAVGAVMLGTVTAYACPPWFAYQPKAPKSLIK